MVFPKITQIPKVRLGNLPVRCADYMLNMEFDRKFENDCLWYEWNNSKDT